jgi:hypothetical protein
MDIAWAENRGGGVDPGMIVALREHHVRTAKLLENLDGLQTTGLVSHLTERLRAGDRRLQELVHHLEDTT